MMKRRIAVWVVLLIVTEAVSYCGMAAGLQTMEMRIPPGFEGSAAILMLRSGRLI